MTATPTHILPQHNLSVTEIDRLEDRLYDHNQLATGRHDGKGLAFVAMDDHGIQIAAIAGYSWAGVAEIKQFWVDENHRGRGLGGGCWRRPSLKQWIAVASSFGRSFLHFPSARPL